MKILTQLLSISTIIIVIIACGTDDTDDIINGKPDNDIEDVIEEDDNMMDADSLGMSEEEIIEESIEIVKPIFHLDVSLDDRKIIIEDTLNFADVGTTIGLSESSAIPDSITLKYGVIFRNYSEQDQEKFEIRFSIREATSYLNSDNNYLDTARLFTRLTKGDWNYLDGSSAPKDKGVSVTHDSFSSINRYTTLGGLGKLDYSMFQFRVDSIGLDLNENNLIISGEFNCQMYNRKAPEEVITLAGRFKGPFRYRF